MWIGRTSIRYFPCKVCKKRNCRGESGICYKCKIALGLPRRSK